LTNCMEHEFTKTIRQILDDRFGDVGHQLFNSSELLRYLNIKTKSASRGSKSRGSFANLYAIYVLVEDYIARDFNKNDGYLDANGAVFTALFKRQRELPFGQKLQNHALNHRLNEEFKRYFPDCEHIPIVRIDNHYWFNEHLLRINIGGKWYNLAESVVEIINSYIEAKRNAFEKFIQFCERARTLSDEEVKQFIAELLEPTVDARIFEIVSYSVLKYHYGNKMVFWGFEPHSLVQEQLTLYKTGRTNANDGGIDFVMKPLGRFFQVTETVDVNKYFLDIDKIERYPITFVVKSSETAKVLTQRIRRQAEMQYGVTAVVEKYMSCIEEIVNVPLLLSIFSEAVAHGFLGQILEEIIKQSKIEFNYEESEETATEIAEELAEAEAEDEQDMPNP
jgi:hypothetical protein